MIEVTTEEHKDLVIVHINGEFNMETIKEVEDTWNKYIDRKPEVIAINCKYLIQIDSTAIGVLVRFLNIAMNKNISLIFYDLNPGIQGLFEKANLNKFFKITTKTKFEAKYLTGR
ncbi:MAG: STAS domain-containing protein [bacterium]|nr:STAS domain-containing protein [bacterium]